MNDLERMLEEELRRRARDAEAIPPPMGEVRRRARRHQTLAILGSLVLLAAVSVGVLQAVRAIGPGTAELGGEEPVRGERRAVLASGSAEGGRWSLVVRWGGEDWCLGIEIPQGSGEGCGFGVPPDALSLSVDSLGGFPTFVEGIVSQRVSRVRVELDDGSVLEPEILRPPPDLGAPFNVFILALDDPVPGRVVVYDAEGLVVAQERIRGLDDFRERPTIEDERLIGALMAFAKAPGHETWERVPFAPAGVWLGLGDRLLVKRAPEELADPDAWVHDVEDFRALVGPFSALELLRDAEDFAVLVGPHPHCASPPMPPPDRMGELRRLSVQPEAWDTCLKWWTVDVFVTEGGEIAAITLDLWEA